MIETNKIYNLDCLDYLQSLSEPIFDLTVTSPPYDNLRTYNGHINQWNENKWKEIIKELYRTTKDGGVVVWVVGDATIKGSETGTSFKQALWAMECGFKLHDTMIFQKHNFSNPSNNRYHQIFEYMFVWVKNNLKTFNPIKDKLNKTAGESNWGANTKRQKDGSFKEARKKIVTEKGMRTNIWLFTVGFNKSNNIEMYKHPATFPEKLAHDHIISWSNENDVVFDPFMGSGTTGAVCKELNRNFIGCEIDEEYFKLAESRINN